MVADYVIDHEDGIAFVRFKNPPIYSDFKSVLDELAVRDIYHRRLWDFSDISYELSAEEIEGIADYGERLFTSTNRMAIIVVAHTGA